MTVRAPFKIRHSPVRTYPSTTQNNYIGAQSVVGRRGTLPTFTNTNSIFVSKTTGSDAETVAANTVALWDMRAGSGWDYSGNNLHMYGNPVISMLKDGVETTTPGIAAPSTYEQKRYSVGPFSATYYLSSPVGILNGITAFSLEFYHKYTAVPSGNRRLFRFHTGAGQGFWLEMVSGTDQLRFGVLAASATSAAGAVIVNQWQHIAVKFNGTNAWTVYVNNTSVITLTQAYTPSGVAWFTFGADFGTSPAVESYLTNIRLSRVARGSFPTTDTPTNAGTLASPYASIGFALSKFPTFGKTYLVIADGATYRERVCIWRYEVKGLYATDGYTPIIDSTPGAVLGTYGARAAGRTMFYTGAGQKCYVSKAGNNGTGTRGNIALPFLTIAAAVSASVSWDCIEVVDSGVYVEDIDFAAKTLTLQAASGKTPTISPFDVSGKNLKSNASVPMTLLGMTFAAPYRAAGSFGVVSGGLLTAYDCTFTLHLNGVSASTSYLNSVAFYGVGANLVLGSTTHSMDNCFFSGSPSPSGSPSNAINARNCTFTGTYLDTYAVADCGVLYMCRGIGANFQTLGERLDSSWLSGCVIQTSAEVSVLEEDSISSASQVILNSALLGGAVSPVGVSATAVSIANTSGGTAITGTAILRDTDSPAPGFISTVAGAENIALQSTSKKLGVFAYITGLNSGRCDAVVFAPYPCTMNGLTVVALQNQGGGVIVGGNSSAVQFCTVSGGMFGVLVYGVVSISSVYVESDGIGYNLNGQGCSLSNDVAVNCASGGVVAVAGSQTLNQVSVGGCVYGFFSNAGGNRITNTVLGNSGAYDLSSWDLSFTSDIGTIDSLKGGGLGSGVSGMPLFRNLETGDLRLQTVELGYPFNSPAKATGDAGQDMGAFSMTYGAVSTSWTTLDFSTSGWRNPDAVITAREPIKQFEGVREDGSTFTGAVAYRTLWTLDWDQSKNDMPEAQALALQTFYESTTGECQVDTGDGRGWVSMYLLKSNPFERRDITDHWSNDTVPRPAGSLMLREVSA